MEWTNDITPRPNPVVLTFRDETGLDPDPLVQLYADLGQTSAHDLVVGTLTDIARTLRDMAHEGPVPEKLDPLLERLAGDADHLGMFGLSRVACDVRVCLETGDLVALGATLARLMRIGDRAITEVWSLTRHSS